MILVRNLIAIVALFSLSTLAVAQTKTPYWASINAGKARMRTGPGQQFPVVWMYQRAGLPVKVIATYPSWRKIEDPDGTQGWMQANLISEKRTAIVIGEARPLRAEPSPSGKIVWQAEPGVSGAITDCRQGWCKLDVGGKQGYIETTHLWGAN